MHLLSKRPYSNRLKDDPNNSAIFHQPKYNGLMMNSKD